MILGQFVDYSSVGQSTLQNELLQYVHVREDQENMQVKWFVFLKGYSVHSVYCIDLSCFPGDCTLIVNMFNSIVSLPGWDKSSRLPSWFGERWREKTAIYAFAW